MLVTLSGAPALYAQQPVTTPTINLDAIVTAKKGPPITALKQSDFTLLDNSVEHPITSFQARGPGQEPMHVTIVLDAVNVTADSLAISRADVQKYLRAQGGNLRYPTQVDFFVEKGLQVQNGFSTNGNMLSKAVEQFDAPLRNIQRTTQYAAGARFNLSIDALRALAQSQATLPGRKLVIWISPGWPLLAGRHVVLDTKLEEEVFSLIVDVSTQLRVARMTLYDINPWNSTQPMRPAFYYQDFLKGVTKPNNVSIGSLALQVLALQSGGLTLNNSDSIVSQLQQCVADSEAYYTISFVPLPIKQGFEYHHIELRVNQPNSAVRTRDGYYALP